MKELITTPANLHKLEFWAATTIFVFSIFFLITPAVRHDIATLWTPNKDLFNEANISFDFYRNYFIPQLVRYAVLYLAFLVLAIAVVPKLIKKEAVFQNSLLIIIVFFLVGLVFGTTDTYLKNYLFTQYASEQATYQAIFQDNFLYAFYLLLLVGFYCIIKYISLYLLAHSKAIESQYKIITRDGLAAFVLWMMSMFLLMISNAVWEIILGWAILIPSAILLYCYSFYRLIPTALIKKKPFRAFLLKVLLAAIVSIPPVFLITVALAHIPDIAIGYSLFNAAFQLLITAPVSWLLFKRQMKGKEELYVLQRELGQSHASFDFLRSQINPHFLFNALNTIYGTAIQEKAERTSEAVEKLGDMMRFMLQENMQEKISLAREIDYLNNYISLQQLRTDPNPSIKIEAQIEQSVHTIQIAPMLLIPFVENAFKHGISLRHASHIKVLLEVKDRTLYFDVYNSKHPKQDNDPEKNKSGVGLRNVKQRLELLYPAKHELIIRETGKEFFVHLTMHLA